MSYKIAGYRKLAQSIAEIGDQYSKAITSKRHRLMHHYFIRCSGLTAATVLLVENGMIPAAYALQKSIVDSMLNGLYIGYVAKDSEIERLTELALKGRGTGYSGMERRAKEIDAVFEKHRPFMKGQIHGIIKRTRESLNEFGHGGLLSTALGVRNLIPEVGYKALADSVLTLYFFISNVFILENLELAPLEALMQEFEEQKKGPS